MKASEIRPGDVVIYHNRIIDTITSTRPAEWAAECDPTGAGWTQVTHALGASYAIRADQEVSDASRDETMITRPLAGRRTLTDLEARRQRITRFFERHVAESNLNGLTVARYQAVLSAATRLTATAAQAEHWAAPQWPASARTVGM